MDKEKLLNQAIYLLKKLYKERSGWHNYTDQEYDLLTQEIDLFLERFKPKPPKQGKYRQIDITESINEILKKNL